MIHDSSVIDAAGHEFAEWVVNQLRLRTIVRRRVAIIDGKLLEHEATVYHDPEAMR